MRSQTLILGAILMLFSFAGFSCSRYDTNPAEAPDPANDEPLVAQATPTDGDEPADAAEPVSEELVGEVLPDGKRRIVIAGGCFWCVEAVYAQLDGVLDVESGYSGGSAETANYQAVVTGNTGHAEVVRITYDPSVITYGTLLKVFFSTAHDPTQLNRQGADVGTQYRSAIFFGNETHRQIAQDYINQLNEAEVYRRPIVTTLEPLEAYYPAEQYHQDFAENNPDHGYIRQVSDPKVEHTREAHPDLLRDEEGSGDAPEGSEASE